MNKILILTIFLVGHSMTAKAHHERCPHLQSKELILCMTKKAPRRTEVLAFKQSLYEQADVVKEINLTRQKLHDEFDSQAIVEHGPVLRYQVYGHGPGGDRIGYFVAEYLFSIITGDYPEVVVQITGVLNAPIPISYPVESDYRIREIHSIETLRPF